MGFHRMGFLSPAPITGEYKLKKPVKVYDAIPDTVRYATAIIMLDPKIYPKVTINEIRTVNRMRWGYLEMPRVYQKGEMAPRLLARMMIKGYVRMDDLLNNDLLEQTTIAVPKKQGAPSIYDEPDIKPTIQIFQPQAGLQLNTTTILIGILILVVLFSIERK